MIRWLREGWNHFWLATQFLTRLPTPPVVFDEARLAGSVRSFPAVGVLLGALITGLALLGSMRDPWLGALLAVVGWVLLTGALHLDGLADLADALGASHRDPERLLAVMKDPHVGSFGVVAIALQLLVKLVLTMLICRNDAVPALILIAAWARWAPLWWTLALPPLAPGMAERFRWQLGPRTVVLWAIPLVAASAALSPCLLLAPLLAWGWRLYLGRRIGGVNGDCLGAGVECLESGLLLALALLS